MKINRNMLIQSNALYESEYNRFQNETNENKIYIYQYYMRTFVLCGIIVTSWVMMINPLECFFNIKGHAALDRNPGLEYNSLLV